MRTLFAGTHLIAVFVGATLMVSMVSAAQTGAKQKPQQHSTEEIIDWIIKNGSFSGEGKSSRDITDNLSSEIVRSSKPCSVVVSVSWTSYNGRADASYSYSIETDLELARLNPENVKTYRANRDGGRDRPSASASPAQVDDFPSDRVVLFSTNGEGTILQTQAFTARFSSGQETKHEHRYAFDHLSISVSSEDMAQRMARAFRDAIAQCGGKPDVKNIY